MVKKTLILIFITIIIAPSCCKKTFELNMERFPYTGNELKIDGYYYSNQDEGGYTSVAIFYKNGICINVYTKIESQDTLNYIESDILLNKTKISRFRNTPTNIGVFQINNESIAFEIWLGSGYIPTFSHFGKILNDTTFILTKWVNNDTRKLYYPNLTYRFKQFNPKPDSTCIFIE